MDIEYQLGFSFEINSQILEDMQVGHFSQKNTLWINTLWKNTLWGNTLWKNTLQKNEEVEGKLLDPGARWSRWTK